MASWERCPDRVEGQGQGQRPGLVFFLAKLTEAPSLSLAKTTGIHRKKGPGCVLCPAPPQSLGASLGRTPQLPLSQVHICTSTHALPTNTHSTKPSTHTFFMIPPAHCTHAHTAAHSFLPTHAPRANRCCPSLLTLRWFLLVTPEIPPTTPEGGDGRDGGREGRSWKSGPRKDQ